MDPLDIARWQFGIVTVYHFLFVPVTIGLSALVAGLQTAWVRTGKEKYLRLTKFFGKLFLINFAIGVVTGIVQEFQFGMNWSDYSRFVGDIFGAPLAIEGAAGVLPGVDVPRPVDLRLGPAAPAAARSPASGWSHIGTLLSAYFILAANSWMQNPVGYAYNPDTGRAELNDFWAVLFNKVAAGDLPAHGHRLLHDRRRVHAAASRSWHLLRRRSTPDADRPMYRTAVRLGAVVTLLGAARRRDLRRRAGQDHDRGPADEDGGRGGALRDRGAGRLLGLHRRVARRQRGEVLDQDPRPAVLPGHRRPSTARSRASTSSASSTARPTARTRAGPTTPPATTPRSSR